MFVIKHITCRSSSKHRRKQRANGETERCGVKRNTTAKNENLVTTFDQISSAIGFETKGKTVVGTIIRLKNGTNRNASPILTCEVFVVNLKT